MGDAETAQDVLQDSLVKMWRFGPKYDRSKGRLFTWLLNICRNTAIDSLRRKKPENSLEQIWNGPADVDISNRQQYELKTDRIGLQEMVSGLDEKYRELIDLVYFKGFSHQEAAEKMDLPLGTVKTRVRSAIQQLRKWVIT